MMKKLSIACLLIWLSSPAFAQLNHNQQYFNGKQLFREGKYNLAMETFKPLIPYDKNNPFSEYASFYYALAAYNQKYYAVAKDQFNQIKTLHPKWDKLDEVNFWLGKIHLENKDYFQGLKVLANIHDKKFQKDIDAVKTKSLNDISDVETLKMMREEYPKDETVAKALAHQLSKNLTSADDKALLESIITNYNLKRSDFIPEAPKSFRKDIYSVSVLMPFMVNTLEPTASRKRNQIVLDFYEGMKLAADTLAKRGVNISLRAYDTERDLNKMKNILSTEELKNTDLMVGPFFQEENKVLQDFSLKNKINIINPFYSNSEMISDNPYGFLLQPSYETLGKKSGEFIAGYATNKLSMVFYGPTSRDSVMASNYIKSAEANGVKILASYRLTKETGKNLTTILATPTEFDEFKYPSQFTLKKDSIGSIFLATDEPLIYSKAVGAIETRGDRVVLLGSESWMDQPVVDMEKYQTLPIILAAPTFADPTRDLYKAFTKKYIKTHGRLPSDEAKLGFECMMFTGNQLKENGVYFQEALNNKGVIPGYLMEGFNFQFSRNNQLVPFISFQDAKMQVVDKR